jgi:hypothetical protein
MLCTTKVSPGRTYSSAAVNCGRLVSLPLALSVKNLVQLDSIQLPLGFLVERADPHVSDALSVVHSLSSGTRAERP